MTIELILTEELTGIAKSGDSVILKDDGTFEINNSDTDLIEKEKARKLQMIGFERRLKERDEQKDKDKKVEKEDTIIQKPFADYKDFADCVSKNKDKENPEAYCGSIKHKIEDEVNKSKYDPRIEKYLSIDKEKSWAILTKFYNEGHLDSYKVLKDFINKIAICPNITDQFEKVMDGWMRDGEANTDAIEKIINACKKEGGNVKKAEQSPEQLRQMEEARKRQQSNDEPVKIEPIGSNDKDDKIKIKPIGKTAEIVDAVTSH
jgi:hypothetical protein